MVIRFVLAFLVLVSVCFVSSAEYYVDFSASVDGDGSFESPWNNIRSVNLNSMSTGDDVYFKVGTIREITAQEDKLIVNWGGTANDRAVIGAYYGKGLFGLNGLERPVLDGNGNTQRHRPELEDVLIR